MCSIKAKVASFTLSTVTVMVGRKPIYKLLEKCADMKMHHKMIAEKKKRERKANQWLQQQILAEHCRRYGNC